MEEILNHGPVVMNFEPTFDFMYYSAGIYSSQDAAEWILEGNTRPAWVL